MPRTRTPSRIALVLLALGLTAVFGWLAVEAIEGRTFEASASWIPSANVALAVRVDALSALFALLITGVGALIAAYAASYVEHDIGRFYLHLTFFMLAMLGVVIADNLLLLYVCWELTSVASFFLIGFNHRKEEARSAARHALLVTVMGGLCLFAGFILLGVAADTWSISALLTHGHALHEHAFYLPALVLVAVGAFTKSAHVPFHSWLPRAMAAPTPVSAYLHAATMVKAGTYLLARFSPVLAGTLEWTTILVTVGAVTMLLGAVRALGESELKRILAYATISALGMFTVLLGVGSSEAVLAALVYLVAHAFYKGALFLYVGAIDHESGVKDARRLRGLGRAMPRVAAAGALAAASLAGIPPLLGFLGKDLAYESVWPEHATDFFHLVPLAATFVTGALFVAVALDIGARPLFGRRAPDLEEARDPTAWLWAPPMVLATLGLVTGIVPSTLAPLAAAAASVVAPEAAKADDAYLHGVTPPLILSLITLVAGAALYATRAPLRRAGTRVAEALRLRPATGYALAMRNLAQLAKWQTRTLQSGYLRRYIMILVTCTVVLLVMGLAQVPIRSPGIASTLQGRDVGLIAIVLGAAWVTAAARSRFTAIAAMGVVGFAIGVIYLILGAPDLAMTQFVVEVLNVSVFVVAFYHIPRLSSRSGTATRARDALIASAFGIVMGLLVFVAAETAPAPRVSDWFLAHSVSAGHGHNVVNVILTDFRSIDTIGEIAVLAMAAFGVLTLLRLRVSSTP